MYTRCTFMCIWVLIFVYRWYACTYTFILTFIPTQAGAMSTYICMKILIWSYVCECMCVGGCGNRKNCLTHVNSKILRSNDIFVMKCEVRLTFHKKRYEATLGLLSEVHFLKHEKIVRKSDQPLKLRCACLWLVRIYYVFIPTSMVRM